MLKLFKGQPSVHEMKDLPENDDAIAQWCRDIYVAKDVAISAALMAVTVLMQILINFSKSERSTAAQSCIRKGKECESGFRGNGQEDKTH
ncbi:hypothetical protein R3W88_033916 [Solanum pinnatisectum]|uniref:Acyltransferase C-terminal domain-containing protein n=1 Tax=Solanum pinnatisectum TaxID=50273 RepID=A0AAV9K1P3_9SOLN|nr:hypothetical protein R3W88_033916 [Solanum pinnatisectum]